MSERDFSYLRSEWPNKKWIKRLNRMIKMESIFELTRISSGMYANHFIEALNLSLAFRTSKSQIIQPKLNLNK